MASLPKHNFSEGTRLSEAWAQIVEKCWKDEAFKKRVLANPAQVLKEYGFNTSDRIKYEVIQEKGSDLKCYLSLPHKRDAKELKEDDLRNISGGAGKANSG